MSPGPYIYPVCNFGNCRPDWAVCRAYTKGYCRKENYPHPYRSKINRRKVA